ncbi:hypothetical protein Goe5_c01970 [Bacillus phage vB_BthM-Goe5]|nr:hypothetical protein Goe5_c01970 [Bacillus phage vB_BthM-Goe5]
MTVVFDKAAREINITGTDYSDIDISYNGKSAGDDFLIELQNYHNMNYVNAPIAREDIPKVTEHLCYMYNYQGEPDN